MAWIKKAKKTKHYKTINERTDKDLQKIYQMKQWKELRKAYLMENPLCEVCLEKGVINGTDLEVHHKKPISKGETIEEMMDIAFDSSNLMTVCKNCHHDIHKKMKSGFMSKNSLQRP